MKSTLISVTLLSIFTASANAVTDARPFDDARPPEVTMGEGGDGLGSVKLASVAASTFLFVPDASQSLLVPVAEGGEGGRGRRWRRHRGDYYHYRGFRSRDSGYRRYYQPYRSYRYERRYYGPRATVPTETTISLRSQRPGLPPP
jgi:hypothetical protein